MTTATELIALDRDPRASGVQDQLQSVRDSLTAVRDRVLVVKQIIHDGDHRLVSLRAEQIVSGKPKSERHDTLTSTLAESREELRTLELEEQALLLAEKTVSATLAKAERQARADAAQRLLSEYRQATNALRDILDQAEAANDRLVELDRALRNNSLAEIGGKPLIMISRSGGAWNALSPLPIKGNAIHVSDWRLHIERTLSE